MNLVKEEGHLYWIFTVTLIKMSINDENHELVFLIEKDKDGLFQKCASNYMNKPGIISVPKSFEDLIYGP